MHHTLRHARRQFIFSHNALVGPRSLGLLSGDVTRALVAEAEEVGVPLLMQEAERARKAPLSKAFRDIGIGPRQT